MTSASVGLRTRRLATGLRPWGLDPLGTFVSRVLWAIAPSGNS